jgi:phosphatidylglycerophosphate synthase
LGRIRGANWWGKIKMITQCVAVFLVLMALLFEFPLFLAAAQWLFGLAVGFAIMSLFSHGL